MPDISLTRRLPPHKLKTYSHQPKDQIPLNFEILNFLIMDDYKINSRMRFDKINARENYVAINYNEIV